MRISLLMILFITAPHAQARVVSGSSQVQHCVLEAIEGKKNEECQDRTEAEDCIGLRRSAEFSQRKSYCKTSVSTNCLRWGHLQNTDIEWISIASYHHRKFERCLEQEYGPLQKGGREAIKRDTLFLDWLAGLDDGGTVFGLKKSGFVMATLEGKDFKEALLDSPFGNSLTPGNAVAYGDAIAEGAIRSESTSDRSIASLQKGTAPLQKPRFPGKTKKQLIHPRESEDGPSPEVEFLGQVEQGTPFRLPSSQPVLSEKALAPAPFFRQRQKNLYSLGLDRSLFEQVSSAYQKRESELVGTEYYLRKLPVASEPRDVSEALRRGTGL